MVYLGNSYVLAGTVTGQVYLVNLKEGTNEPFVKFESMIVGMFIASIPDSVDAIIIAEIAGKIHISAFDKPDEFVFEHELNKPIIDMDVQGDLYSILTPYSYCKGLTTDMFDIAFVKNLKFEDSLKTRYKYTRIAQNNLAIVYVTYESRINVIQLQVIEKNKKKEIVYKANY
jgi:hypothetical protein